MFIKKNVEASQKINAATFQGKSREEIKPLYVERNIFDLEVSTPIYRICALKYLEEDIRHQTLTHVRVDPQSWGDPYENPLLNVIFDDGITGEQLSLEDLFKNIFAVCWSLDYEEEKGKWDDFSHGLPAVRIQTTVGKLLERVMHVQDEFFMLRHYVGKVEYQSKAEIEAWRNDPDYGKHLDSLGQGIALAAMKLRSVFSDEREARLIYSYSPDHPWVREHVSVDGKLCKHPFDWTGIIDNVIVGPRIQDGGEKDVRETLRILSIECPVTSSSLRVFRG